VGKVCSGPLQGTLTSIYIRSQSVGLAFPEVT
jgi:hypothetical protein